MDTEAVVTSVTLVVTAGQTCFLAWLGAKTAEQRARIVELQRQVHELTEQLHHRST